MKPVYQYTCEKCGTIEIEKHMTDPNPEKCPVCDSPLQRLFAPHNVVLRGAGFFATDSRLDHYGEPDVYDRAVIDHEFD